MELLKTLEIDILPPTSNFAIPFKVFHGGKTYFCAEIYEFRDDWAEYVGNIHCVSEIALKCELKESFNIDYRFERTLKNFIDWFEKITNKKLDEETIRKIYLKFQY